MGLLIFVQLCFVLPMWTYGLRSIRSCSYSLSRLQHGTPRSAPKTTLTMAGSSDTIFALSSGPLSKTGVAVIRISGPDSRRCLETLITKDHDSRVPTFPEARRASLRKLYDPKTKDVLDHALVLWFPGPKSFTGDDIVELHCHGGRAVILGVFSALEHLDDLNKGSFGSIRPAERGEFTRRAFDSGRMDLTEVEGLADLLAADTSEQRKQALRQMDGYLRIFFEGWRQELLGCLAHTEAVIDFGDDDREDDVSDATMYALLPRVQTLRDELIGHLRDGRRGELVRDGVKIALAGPPNAGKSSLMNALARRPAAIVSPIAGTTRDIVEVRMDLGGIPCIISDTAGLRSNSVDMIEVEGMRRAREAFKQAQLKIFVGDASDKASLEEAEVMLQALLKEVEEEEDSFDNDDSEEEGEEKEETARKDYRVLTVLNKADLVLNQDAATDGSSGLFGSSSHSISCTTGKGLNELEAAISIAIRSLLESGGEASEGTLITRERHRRHLKQCVEHLDNFLSARLQMDAAAEELRLAMQELGRVTGRVDVEELLDIIFRDFCIGK